MKKSGTGCFQIGGTSDTISCYLFEKVFKIGKFFCNCGYLTLYRVKTTVFETISAAAVVLGVRSY